MKESSWGTKNVVDDPVGLNFNKLELSNIDGDFLNGEIVVGQESQAQYQILTTEVFDVVDPYAQNDVIETEGDAIRNFTESNPFGNP